MKPKSEEKFREEYENMEDVLAFMPLSGYHSYQFYAWAFKATLVQLALSIFIIIIPSYFSETLMKLSSIQSAIYYLLDLFPIFQVRFEVLLQLNKFSASQYAVCSFLCILAFILFTIQYLYGYFKHWSTLGKHKKVDGRGIIGAAIGCVMLSGAAWGYFILTPTSVDPEYLGTFSLMAGPFFPIYCALIAVCFPFAIMQPIVFIIKLVHQLTFGFYKERH
ncbi:hypothetical protein [Pseudovibrio brasiliensis]|uniref:Uncharacterized protein n=1 Tax=Pseudovibrio brasiliensis TaxID=1898042 RepID=A0ABX8AVS1_9HYPH|nr:hypothetical protein [Pseudovibrio brasiliensis]QUS58708.1 hypothetical protein KGB56_25230 [Pseudovibrio brasiliensis]